MHHRETVSLILLAANHPNAYIKIKILGILNQFVETTYLLLAQLRLSIQPPVCSKVYRRSK